MTTIIVVCVVVLLAWIAWGIRNQYRRQLGEQLALQAQREDEETRRQGRLLREGWDA